MQTRADHRPDARLEDHRASLREFAQRAAALSPSQWLTPRADGKWTPAQETRHLILTYEALLRDLRDQDRVRLKGTPLRRWVWRLVGLTSIMIRKRIPVAVRAPREFRPEPEATPASALLDALYACGDTFEAVFVDKIVTEPARRVTHPFFGGLTLHQTVTLLTVHNRHHAAFLPAASSPQGDSDATHDSVDASPRSDAGVR